jgi:uncharacterized membrane protein YdjX (TVP38/TMEM64 family)
MWAYLAAPAVMAVVALLPVPAEGPAMLNGLLFGPWVGSLVSWIGAMAGAWASFELSRRFGRGAVTRWVGPAALARVDGLTHGVGWWGLIVLRLMPVVAFTALNYGLGLTAVSRRRFLWTTAVGIVPGAVVFTSSGAGLGYLWQRSSTLGWTAAAAVALLALVVYARRAREARSAPGNPAGDT